MSTGGRPKGPLRQYTIECMWPMQGGVWRTAVRNVDEKTARRSAAALRRMRHAFRVKVAFFSADKERNRLGEHLASQWSREGEIVHVSNGFMRTYMPGWALGKEPLEREKAKEPSRVG